ncbi:chaperonin containing t-complex protein 1, eta subunit, tcph, partial [Reticulomyxa filosa]
TQHLLSIEHTFRETLERFAQTALQSKLTADSSRVLCKNGSGCSVVLELGYVGVANVPGGNVTSSELVRGVAFKRTFSYAVFEQQPKKLKNSKVVLLNVELELKDEKENAEIKLFLNVLLTLLVLIRLNDQSKYQSIVEAKWKIIYDKLDVIVKSGAKVVLSRMSIGDVLRPEETAVGSSAAQRLLRSLSSVLSTLLFCAATVHLPTV